MGLLEVGLDPATVVVAVDPGKVMNRVWVSNGAGLLEEPVSLPVARSGITALEKMLATHAGERVIAIEATGSLHRAWASELERLHPGSLRLFAPSETKAARTQQLLNRRFLRLTSLPGVAVKRAAAFAAHSLPIDRFPDADHLYSATGLAPAMYESATIRRRGRISRQGLAEHRDALMGIAWGLSLYSPSFADRNAELRGRGMAPIQARVALARNACRLIYRILVTQQPFDEAAYRRGRLSRGR